MAIVEVISKLNATAQFSERQDHYVNITKLFSENLESACEGLSKEHVKSLCNTILLDLKNESSELPQLVKILQCVLQNKFFQKIFSDEEKVEVIKGIIDCIDSNQHENTLVNCFSVLILIPPTFNIENSVLNDLLERMGDVLSKKNDAISAYFIICNYFHKFLKDYEEKLSNFIPILSKLVFLPLCHPSSKVREVAEKTLDGFPKLLLYTADEQATSSLLKLVKETYSRDMLLLFTKDKQELYVLKVWKHVVNALGNCVPFNFPSFFQVIERGFKSSLDEVCISSFIAWKSLISTFVNYGGVLNDSKKLRFILKPFKNAKSSESVLLVACDSWWFLAWSLAENLSSRFTEVCIPLLELTVGKITNGHPEKPVSKGGPVSLVKKCCHILLRFLEQPPNDSFNRVSSPKRLPNIPYPALQAPIDIKIITRHFKEILHAFRIIIDVCGSSEDMKHHLECLMKSILYIVSTLIEDSNKESVEAVSYYLNFLTDVIEAKAYPSLLCLKCIETFSKFSRKTLVSHHFICGPRKSQDILCTTLLKLLLNPHIFPSESPKRFVGAYNRLVQAGLHESFYSLLITQKFMHVIRAAIGMNTIDVDVLIDVWSGIATPILERIEKTQEVNQGDKQEHDFSTMYDVLVFPFEYILPVYLQQFRIRPAFKLWTTLYKAFIRCASLVTTTVANESTENFCVKLKGCLKEELIKKPHFFESVCLFLQVIIESIDFSSGTTSGPQGIAEVALMVKRKKPLGNLTSFVDIVNLLLKTYHLLFIEAEEDSNLTSTPTIQRKLNIVKSAAPLDLVKLFFGSIKFGGIISFALEQLVDPLSKLFLMSTQKRNLANHIDAKLEMVWNVMTSTIERYYLGPYDSEFLATLSPILEATFSHPKRHLKEKSRRFWFATFGPNTSSLKFPDSLKNVLIKMKLPLLPDDISPTEFSISPMTDSVPEDSVDVNPFVFQLPQPKPLPVKSTPCVNGEVSKTAIKENKPTTKISIDDLPSEEFVKIDSAAIIPTASRRRSIRKRKSFVPTLYNDLSQDTSNMMSSGESQDTIGSASLEQADFKEPLIEHQKASNKESADSPTEGAVRDNLVHKESFDGFKSVPKSPMVIKFEKSLGKSLKSPQVLDTVKEVITIESLSDCEESDENAVKKLKVDSMQQNENKVPGVESVSEKMSVFSPPGAKQTLPRITRRNIKLSQSFSVASKKGSQNKLEFKKLNKSCIDIIDLSDSEEIIPSSQGSTDNENSIKLSSSSKSSSPDDLQKSASVENIDEHTFKQSSTSLFLVKEKNFEDFMDKNEVKSCHTSTTSISKTSMLCDDENGMEIEITSKNVINNVTELVPDPIVNNKIPESSDKSEIKNEELNDNTKTLENKSSSKENVNAMEIESSNKEDVNVIEIESSNKEGVNVMEIESSNKEDVKDLNFLLDAVDEELNASPLLTPVNHVESAPDAQMEDMSVPETKNFPVLPKSKHKETFSDLEPIAKRSRLSLKNLASDSFQGESYSLKLRKKNTNVPNKPTTKPRKKKTVLKEVGINKQKPKDHIEDVSGGVKITNHIDDIKTENQLENGNEEIETSNHLEDFKKGIRTRSRSENDKEDVKTENQLENDKKNIKTGNSLEDGKKSIRTRNHPGNGKGGFKVTNQTKDSKGNKTDSFSEEEKEDSSQESSKDAVAPPKDNHAASCLHENVTNISDSCNIEIKTESSLQSSSNESSSQENSPLTGLVEEDYSPEFMTHDAQMKIRLNSNKQVVDDVQGFENSESCEIFDNSENSCIEFQDNKCESDSVTSSAPSSSAGSSQSQIKESNCSPISVTNLFETNTVSKVSHTSDKILHTCVDSNSDRGRLNDIPNEKVDDINPVMVIPSSLEDENSSDTSNKLSTDLIDENPETDFKDSNKLPVKSSDLAFSADTKIISESKVNKMQSDSLCQQFSDVEDYADSEIQNVINSIVDASSQTTDDKKTDLVISEENLITNIQISTINSEDIQNSSYNIKSQIQCEHFNLEQPEVIEILTQDESSSENSDSVNSSNDSYVIINSNNNIDKFKENSDKMDVGSIDTDSTVTVKSKDCIEIEKNGASDINNSLEKSISNFSTEIEHSYSLTKPHEIYIDSNIEKDLVNDKVADSQVPCKNEVINMECSETSYSQLSRKTMEASKIYQKKFINSQTDHSITVKIPHLSSGISATQKTVEVHKTLINESEVICDSEVKGVIKELVVLVDKIHYYKVDTALDEFLLKNNCLKGGISCANLKSAAISLKKISSSNGEKSVSSDSDAADKENQVVPVSEEDRLAKGSKKRKIKNPIRSPFNFRQRGKVEGSKKHLTNIAKSEDVVHVNDAVPQNPDLVQSLFSKSDLADENADNSMTKIISSIVDSITDDDVADSEMLTSIPCSSRARKVALSNDELTDLNTRFNASAAPTTRRSKFIAAVTHHQKSTIEKESEEQPHSDIVIVCSEDSSSNLNSILKKRKASGSTSPPKERKVTFASPLIQELVIENYSETKGIETITMSSLQTLSKKRKKVNIVRTKNKPTLTPVHFLQAPSSNGSEDIPSSSEYQDSDVLDFCELPVSPALINCQDSISSILKDLTSPSWVRGLESLLLSKNIKTIGDVCKLNIHQLKALPFKSPKVLTLHKALAAYLNQTQEAVLEKIKVIDDGSVDMDTTTASSSATEASKTMKIGISTVNDESKLLNETAMELVRNSKLKELPLSLLGQLIKACGHAVTEASRES